MAADQLNNFACVADGAVREQEEQPGVATDHRLPQDPGERCQDVSSPHVRSDSPDVIASLGQGLLTRRRKIFSHSRHADLCLLLDKTAKTRTCVRKS